jgi:tRNA threonylcarbamoyladenosine biosynthesis protein TsaE
VTEQENILTFASLAGTNAFARKLGGLLRPGDVLLLFGGLGAGKTTLTQAIAQGLAVPDDYYVSSPSFALLHEYPGRLPLYHMDCYRLTGEDDVEGAGLLDYLESCDGVCVIEWPERLGTLMPDDHLAITLTPGQGEERQLELVARGRAWQERWQEILSIC